MYIIDLLRLFILDMYEDPEISMMKLKIFLDQSCSRRWFNFLAYIDILL